MLKTLAILLLSFIYVSTANAGQVTENQGNIYVSIHTRPHPSGETRRRIEVDELFFPVNEAVTVKDNDTGVSLSKLKNPPKGGGFKPARKSDNDNAQQLTSLGRDSQPVLSPDGKQVVFVRAAAEPDNQANELWLMDVSGNNAHAIVLGHDDEDMKKNLTALNNPLFSLDGKAVYFLSAAWVTSDAIHIVDLATHKQHFVTDGNSLELVPSGKYHAYLIVSKHKYHKSGGSYEDYWLVSPKGKAIKSLGEDQEQVNAFIRAN